MSVFAVAVAVAASAQAQEFPTKTVRIVSPYAAGGSDVLARQLAERLSAKWKQPVIVENRPGASTNIAAKHVATSPADGHTLLFTSDATTTANPHLFQDLFTKMAFDPVRDLSPVTQVVGFAFVVVAHPSLGVKTMAELLDKSRTSPVPIPYASFGNASQSHVFFEYMAARHGLKLTQVPYKGVTPSMHAVIGGEVMLGLAGSGASVEFVKNGRLRALAIGGSSRSPSYPDVPTLTELGMEDLDPKPWLGMYAPRGTSLEIRRKIANDVREIIMDSASAKRYVVDLGYERKASDPEDFEKHLARELVWRGEQIRLGKITAAE
ncbi:MAG: Bug family tripartite tricarboxylate transporter substrate binding protein [Burkholderiaceae bacterium]